ncbi:hypothetical protein NXV02_08660 [Bacteroides ovatus]|nr:hypothetical protein [Bacteroides ovatus]MCS2760495.1 hypothetical protein [Bacteroides ovatus]
MVNFAKAVNNGTNTSRWQNDAGEVVLLNDIDMSSVTSWTPIGDIDASNYTTAEPYVSVHPFTGTFNGQGYAIKNLNCSADITNGGLAYYSVRFNRKRNGQEFGFRRCWYHYYLDHERNST